MRLVFGNPTLDVAIAATALVLVIWCWKSIKDRLTLSAMVLFVLCGAQFAAFCVKYGDSPLAIVSGVTFAMSGLAAIGRLFILRRNGAGGEGPRYK